MKMETQWKVMAIARIDEVCSHPNRRIPGLGVTGCPNCRIWFEDALYFEELRLKQEQKRNRKGKKDAADAVSSLIDEVS
jgi:hypothetical protein